MFNIILLGLVSLLTDVSTEMVYPLLPIFLVARLGASPAILGLIEGAAESLASLLRVWAGHLSDRAGRRKPYAILGYASSMLGKVGLFLATTWWWVLGARLADRFGKGVRSAPRDALIAESSGAGGRGRAFGLHRMMDTAGASVGVLLAYYFLGRTGQEIRPIFLASLVPAALGVLLLLFVREKAGERGLGPRSATISLSRPAAVWGSLDRRLKAFLAVSFLFTLGNSSNQFLFLRANGLGFTARAVVLLYLVYNLTYSAVSYPAGRMADRTGRKLPLVLGYAAYGLVYLGFAFARNAVQVWLLFVLYGVYMGVTDGVSKAFVADLVPGERRATVMGLHGTLTGIGLFPASLVAGVLWTTVDPAAPFILGGVTGLAASLGLFLLL